MKNDSKDGPDRGWSWIIAFCAFLISLILVGIYRTSGVLLVAFLKEYGLTRKDSAWPLLLCFSLVDITGIIVGPLGQRFGIRPITIAGSVISAAGVSFCYWANSITYLTVSFGIIFGIGFGLAYHLMAVIVNQYFLEHRGTANGIANSGACFGSLIFPPIYEYLISIYGLNGCLLLIGGIILQLTVFACLMKSPSWYNNGNITEDIIATVNDNSESSKIFQKTEIKFFETNVILVNYSSNNDFVIDHNIQDINGKMASLPILNYKIQPAFERNNCLRQHSKNKITNNFNHSNGLESFSKEYDGNINRFELSCIENLNRRNSGRTFNEAFERTINSQDTCSKTYIIPNNSVERITHKNSGVENKSLVPEMQTLKVANLNQNDTSKSSLTFKLNICDEINHQNYLNDMALLKSDGTTENVVKDCRNENTIKNNNIRLDLPEFEKVISLRAETSKNKIAEDIYSPISQNTRQELSILMCFKLLLTCPMFYILAMSNVFFFAKEDMFFVISVDFYMDKGIAETDTKYILFLFSVCDLVGRLCFGWVTDRKLLRRSHFMMICMAIVAVVFFCFPLANGYVSLLVLNCIYGVMLGCSTIIYFVIPVDYLDMEIQAVAFGCMAFLNGIVTLLFSFMIGYFRDNLGSYSNIFYIMGAVSLASSALWLLENCFTKKKEECLRKS